MGSSLPKSKLIAVGELPGLKPTLGIKAAAEKRPDERRIRRAAARAAGEGERVGMKMRQVSAS